MRVHCCGCIAAGCGRSLLVTQAHGRRLLRVRLVALHRKLLLEEGGGPLHTPGPVTRHLPAGLLHNQYDMSVIHTSRRLSLWLNFQLRASGLGVPGLGDGATVHWDRVTADLQEVMGGGRCAARGGGGGPHWVADWVSLHVHAQAHTHTVYTCAALRACPVFVCSFPRAFPTHASCVMARPAHRSGGGMGAEQLLALLADRVTAVASQVGGAGGGAGEGQRRVWVGRVRGVACCRNGRCWVLTAAACVET
mgnify:CR=1 FL=1